MLLYAKQIMKTTCIYALARMWYQPTSKSTRIILVKYLRPDRVNGAYVDWSKENDPFYFFGER